MKKYYVNLPIGTKDHEFQQVLDLLKEKGYKQNGSHDKYRQRKPDGSWMERGFLYLFNDRAEAEHFAEEVRAKSGDPDWEVFEVDVEPIDELIQQHREMTDEPLVLAMYYDAGDDPREIYLLEIIENFGANGINPDRELFEVTFKKPNPSGGGMDQTWHLILTNPPEFDIALREKWRHAEQIRRAVTTGRYEVIFMTDDEGIRNRDLIHA